MIHSRRLTKKFGKVTAVDAIDLHVPRGSAYGLIGPNGAGKTTTLRMLASLEEPTSGALSIDGLEVGRANGKLHRRVGFMNDTFALNEDLFVWEYLEFYGRIFGLDAPTRSRRIDRWLNRCKLSAKRNALIKELSRGMRQRLYLAKTLLGDPDVLLLDEPASGLDPNARADFREIVNERKRSGKTIVISSHILPELSDFCDSVGVMEKGKLIRSGPVDELRVASQRPRRYRIETTGDPTEILRSLENSIQATEVEISGAQIRFLCSGGPNEAATLLRELCANVEGIHDFGPERSDIEDVFERLDCHEVS